MNDPDLQRRLNALIGALVSPAVARPATDDAGGGAAGNEAQRIATGQIDELLRRVSTLTTALRSTDAHEWDDVDQLAARLLLVDLTAIASTTRALNGLASSRLTSALTDLRAAAAEIEREVKEASAS